MAADHWSIEYHLTPDGWVSGTSKTFSKVDGKEIPRPANAVETWEEDCYQRSMWSGDEYSYKMLWSDHSVPEETRRELRNKFPNKFHHTPAGF
jgi:hypothetical protein